ncbi:hypothetical protein [Mammaliicoccus lentus]|uniref:hypothetical protein n=1 Tax=Mammaliicoccus lentus TaxID=42858 RepID=UPI0010720E1F|nr:hypothetical protein [Mammaliicoccus lentus]MBF0750511.1 hypothetical protein [Mammaliicoccus lentus]TFU56414.1 hypothetical protein E4T93_14090 [Mammaliicoccus lentus]WQK49195.1 hypothetical protein P3U54_09245 [Mammaliicoccus lentus]
MEFLKFTEDEKHRIFDYLNSIQRNVCCNNPKIQVLEEAHRLPVISNDINKPGLDVFVTVCDHCAKTEMFDVTIAKIKN